MLLFGSRELKNCLSTLWNCTDILSLSLLQSSYPSAFPELIAELEIGDFSPQNGLEQRKRFGPVKI